MPFHRLRRTGMRLVYYAAFSLVVLVLYQFIVPSSALPTAQNVSSPTTTQSSRQEGYGGAMDSAPPTCGKPADMAKRDFGWDASYLAPKYRTAATPQLCDNKWPWSTSVCLDVTSVLSQLGWPTDLLEPQYLQQRICVQPKQPGSTQVPVAPTIPADNNGCLLNNALPWTPPGVDMCAVVSKVFDGLFLSPIRSAMQSLTTQVSAFMWTTPPIYDGSTNNNLTDIWQVVLYIVDALVVLVVAWGGIKLIISKQSWHSALSYSNIIDMVPRVLFALLAAHFSLHFAEIIIKGNNVLCTIFAGDHQLIGLIQMQTADGFVHFLQFFYGIMALLLFVQGIVRIGLLSILLVLSPAWMFAWAIPETQRLARLGTTGFIGLAFLQAGQILIMDVGGHLLATIVLGAAPQYAIMNVLGGIAVLYVALRLPSFLGQWVLQTSSAITGAGSSVVSAAGSAIGWVAALFA